MQKKAISDKRFKIFVLIRLKDNIIHNRPKLLFLYDKFLKELVNYFKEFDLYKKTEYCKIFVDYFIKEEHESYLKQASKYHMSSGTLQNRINEIYEVINIKISMKEYMILKNIMDSTILK